jgi:predicted HicB family RNase H-like nuclease
MFKNRDYSARNIRRIIKGRAWNTKTAELVYETLGRSEVMHEFGGEYYDDGQRLYRTRKGNLFFIAWFDKLTYLNEDIGHEFVDDLKPISYEEAKLWLETYAPDEIYEQCFEVTEAGDGEVVISLRTTERLSKAIKVMAKIRKQSSNAFLNNLITEAAKENLAEIKAYAEQVSVRKIAAQKLLNANNKGG